MEILSKRILVNDVILNSVGVIPHIYRYKGKLVRFGYIELEEKQYLIIFLHQPENYDVIIQKLKT